MIEIGMFFQKYIVIRIKNLTINVGFKPVKFVSVARSSY